MLKIACLVEKGVRPENDDRASVNGVTVSHGAYYAQCQEGLCLAVVCDGLGGEPYGWKAAELVAEYFSGLFGQSMTAEMIEAHVAGAENTVIAAQRDDRRYSQMKTTLAGLYINRDDCIAFNVGDSRIYRHRTYLSRMSVDHTAMQEQIDIGLTPLPGAEHFLSRCIGADNSTPEIVEGTGRVFVGDTYVLCTDGIWGVLTDDDFEIILSEQKQADKAAASLMDLAVTRGSQDNLSIIVIMRD